MADTGIFCTGAEVLRKAGDGASATSITEAYTNDFIAQAESFINVATRTNFSDSYGALNADVKLILKEAASDLAAIYVINYDLDNFASLAQVQTRLDVLRDSFDRALKILMETKHTDFIEGA